MTEIEGTLAIRRLADVYCSAVDDGDADRNHWVNIDGAHAEGQAYLLACHLREGANGLEEEVAVIRYRDSYRLTDDGWRFEERNACRQWTTLRPVASGQHEIDAMLHGRRQS